MYSSLDMGKGWPELDMCSIEDYSKNLLQKLYKKYKTRC